MHRMVTISLLFLVLCFSTPSFLFAQAEIPATSTCVDDATKILQSVSSIRARFDCDKTNLFNLYKDLDNENSRLAWGYSPLLESYLTMYELTGMTSYLDDFIVSADIVASKRDSITGKTTYDGKSLPAWPSSGKFTLGIPQVIPDAAGNPSLTIQTYGWVYANTISINISDGSYPNTYKITATRQGPNVTYLQKVYDNLTQSNAEEIINFGNVNTQLLRVDVVGDGRPINRTLHPPKTQRYIMSVNTGQISAPFARFADIVKQNNLTRYSQKASEYTSIAEAAMGVHDDEWVEEEDRGYYRYRRGAPFWSDGVVVPNNYLSSLGRVYLFLYRITGKSEYKERVERIINTFKHCPYADNRATSCLRLMPNGSWVWPYSWREGVNGWSRADNMSTNTPSYSGNRNIEDLGHGLLDFKFLYEAYRNQIGINDDDISHLAKTVSLNILSQIDNNRLPQRIDGSSMTSPATSAILSGYIIMADIDSNIATAIKKHLISSKSLVLGPEQLAVVGLILDRKAMIDKTPATELALPLVTHQPRNIVAIPGDANGNGLVDMSDFSAWRGEYFDRGRKGELMSEDWTADFDRDRRVTMSDFVIWLDICQKLIPKCNVI